MGKIYYKVLTQELKSVISRNRPLEDRFITENLIIQYKINEWTYPKVNGTNLMCFSKLSSAKDFINKLGWRINVKIFKCTVKGARKKGFFVSAWVLDICFVEKLYKQKRMRKKITCADYRECLYPNTVFCSAIKLLYEVK